MVTAAVLLIIVAAGSVIFISSLQAKDPVITNSLNEKEKVAFALFFFCLHLNSGYECHIFHAVPCHAILSPPCTRPQLKTSKSHLKCFSLVAKRHLSRLGSLKGLLAPGLGLRLSLLLLGGELESGGALDGLGAKVGAVTLLVGGVDDGAVDLAAGGGALELSLLESAGGLVGVAAELGGEDNLAVLASLETDRRGVGEGRVLVCRLVLVVRG